MWEYQHTVQTTAAPDAVWRLWADVRAWDAWNADIERVEIDGPFASGSHITMTPAGEDPVRLQLAEVAPGESFTDEAEFAGVTVRTTHRLASAGDGRTEIVYHMRITGPAADQVGPEVGPAITADFPETMAALAALAESA